MTRFYTYKKVALAHKAVWQALKFLAGKGYYLVGVRPKPKTITMYDSVTVSQIPANAEAVAGYVGGMWPTFPSLKLEFPHAHKLSIAVNALEDAECLDVERGDASPDQAASWVHRQIKRGVKRPVVYTSVSEAPLLLRALARGGISRDQIRLWTAHYTFVPHFCTSKCWSGFSGTADATQYSDHALGRTLDASICSPSFFA